MRNNVGKWAEEIVSQWLIVKGWQILHRRWNCRYGEIDIIARSSHKSSTKTNNTLIFVEVKSRGKNNWDQNGLLSINEKKQAKLRLAGEIFLARYPQYYEYDCRFDVALLGHRRLNSTNNSHQQLTLTPQLEQPINYHDYQFTIVSYLINAF